MLGITYYWDITQVRVERSLHIGKASLFAGSNVGIRFDPEDSL